jgi:hypothetical protein
LMFPNRVTPSCVGIPNVVRNIFNLDSPKEKGLFLDKNFSCIDAFTRYHRCNFYLGSATTGVNFCATGGSCYLRICTTGGTKRPRRLSTTRGYRLGVRLAGNTDLEM